MQNTGMQGSTPAASRPESAAEQTSAGLSRLSETAHQTMERLTQAASQATSRLAPRVEELLNAPPVERARTYMRAHPLAAIGIAVAIGLVLSRLLSRR